MIDRRPGTIGGPPLPAVVAGAAYLARPVEFVTACRRRYGPVFRIRFPGVGETYYLADPAVISALFALDGTVGHAGAVNRPLLEPLTGGRSLLTLDGAEHLRERKLLAPAFHGAALHALEPAIRAATLAEIERWPDIATMAMRPAMQRITFDVILDVVFGVRDQVLRAELITRFEPVFAELLLMSVPLLAGDYGRFSPGGRYRRNRRRMDATIHRLIARRRAEEPRADLLGMLLAATDGDGAPISDEHVRDELVTILFAGHETTATALSWAFERLSRHPEYQDDIRSGGPEVASAVADETLRVRPVVLDVGRRLAEPVELAGYAFPAGASLWPAIGLVHADPANHPDPMRFDPYRNVGKRPDPATWLPFGGGRRRCVGAGLAELELRVVLREVLGRYRIGPVGDRPEPARVRGVTLAPRYGGRVRIERIPGPG